jgi:hemerythrin-like domain-containing protein
MTDDLATRTGLPDALGVLLAEYPRAGWQADPGFDDLIRFWLERHLLFRQIVGLLDEGTEAIIAGSGDPRAHGGRLARLGQHLIEDLHGHHHVEDTAYFPILSRHDSRLERGFAILDADHHALHDHLAGFAMDANAVLDALARDTPCGGPADRLQDRLAGFGRFLDRHLTDEEDLIVPVLLKFGPPHFGRGAGAIATDLAIDKHRLIG